MKTSAATKAYFYLLCLATLLFLSAGCQDFTFWMPYFPHEAGVWVDPKVSADEVMAGCKTWAPMGVNCFLQPDQDKALVQVHPHWYACNTNSDPRGNVYAETMMATHQVPHSDIYFKTDCGNRWAVLSHEFGHAWGLKHVTEPSALMYPYMNMSPQNVHLTPADVDEFNAIWK